MHLMLNFEIKSKKKHEREEGRFGKGLKREICEEIAGAKKYRMRDEKFLKLLRWKKSIISLRKFLHPLPLLRHREKSSRLPSLACGSLFLSCDYIRLDRPPDKWEAIFQIKWYK